MKDELKGKYFRELAGYEAFAAQLTLEDDQHTTLLKDLVALDLSKPNLDLEYARLRGAIDALTRLRTAREHFVNLARVRDANS